MRRILISAISLLLTSQAAATDLAFGADTLPYLDERAELVGYVAEVQRGAAGQRASGKVSLYTARIRETVRGEAAPGAQVALLLPAGFDVKDPSELSRGMLFLRPVAGVEIEELGISTAPRAYWVVSGHYGAIGASDRAPAEDAAVRVFVTERTPAQRMDWARKQKESKQEFLQRSALFELAEPAHRDTPEAAELLGEAALSADNPLPTRGTAIQLLETTRSPAAASVLEKVATDAATPQSLRLDAVRALPAVPGGEAVLQDLSNEATPVAPEAKELLLEMGPKSAPQTLDMSEVERRLNPTNAAERQKAIRQLSEATPTDATFGAFAGVFQKGVPAGNRERLQTIEAIGQFRDPRAVRLLSRVAKDKALPELVRNQAILELANQPAGLSLTELQTLSGTLEAGPLKDLATGLATQ